MNSLLLDACAGSAQIVKCCCDSANATNGQDVEIANAICCSVVELGAIIVGGFLAWKLMNHIVNGISGFYKRQCAKKDREEKQNADLKAKLLNFLEKNTSEGDFTKEKGILINTKKKFDSKESQYYIDVLNHFIGEEKIPNNSKTPQKDGE